MSLSTSSSTTASTSAAQELAVLADPERVAAMLAPIRLQILRELGKEPDSAAGLARKLGLPRQQLGYHLRELENAGHLELAFERQRRGCTERGLRPSARAWLLDPTLLGDLAGGPDTIRDRFSSSYLIAVAARLVRDVAAQRHAAAEARQWLPTLTLETEVCFKNAEDRAAFAEELTAAVAGLIAKYHDAAPASRAYRFVIGGHPAPKIPTDDRPETDGGAKP